MGAGLTNLEKVQKAKDKCLYLWQQNALSEGTVKTFPLFIIKKSDANNYGKASRFDSGLFCRRGSRGFISGRD